MAANQYLDRHWDERARARFLLRPDIPWPLSVDQLLWPSVFFMKDFRPEWNPYSTIEVDQKNEDAWPWRHLDAMRAFYEPQRSLAPGGVYVGVELLTEKEDEGGFIPYVIDDGIQCGIGLEETVPDRLPEGSTLLGFDVADAGRISGLADCEYTEEEIRNLSPVWAPRLNESGLLTTLEDAMEFRQVCDKRVPEHAPFWIYALWRLPSARSR